MRLWHIHEGLFDNFLPESPVFLLANTKEQGRIEEGQEIGITCLLHIFQVLMNLGEGLYQKFAVIWGIKHSKKSIPHALACLKKKVSNACL
jgi:hypothetical protein